jgi:hypothetical protein
VQSFQNSQLTSKDDGASAAARAPVASRFP